MESLVVPFVAPIPVGHRVRLLWTERATDIDDDGITDLWIRVTAPVIKDLDTGVIYCAPELLAWVEPEPLGLRPPGGGHRVSSNTIVARVAACVVASRASDSAEHIGTRLLLEPIVEHGPYR